MLIFPQKSASCPRVCVLVIPFLFKNKLRARCDNVLKLYDLRFILNRITLQNRKLFETVSLVHEEHISPFQFVRYAKICIHIPLLKTHQILI